MIAIYALVFRILAGEKYVRTSREDTKVWLSALAAVPPGIGLTVVWAQLTATWPTFFVWLTVAALACAFLVVWFGISRLRRLPWICTLAVVGWIVAIAGAIYLNR